MGVVFSKSHNHRCADQGGPFLRKRESCAPILSPLPGRHLLPFCPGEEDKGWEDAAKFWAPSPLPVRRGVSRLGESGGGNI